MAEPNKLPLKRVEFSLTKFNDVAIPHHLDLLRQHKANILKYSAAEQWARARAEQTHAARVAAQLRGLLAELDALRRQVQPQDHARFDALTQRARDNTLRAIVDYLETSPLSINSGPSLERAPCPSPAVVGSLGAVSTDSVGVVAHVTDAPAELVQLQIDEQELSLASREAVLSGWGALHEELSALHAAWRGLAHAAHAQRQPVDHTQQAVAHAADNVQAARAHLSLAARLGLGAGGAALGALLAGPVGLLLGAKAGAAGYWAGALLGAPPPPHPAHTAPDSPPPKDKAQ